MFITKKCEKCKRSYLKSINERTKYCPPCEKEIKRNGEKFCLYCGKKIKYKEWFKLIISETKGSWERVKYCDSECGRLYRKGSKKDKE